MQCGLHEREREDNNDAAELTHACSCYRRGSCARFYPPV